MDFTHSIGHVVVLLFRFVHPATELGHASFMLRTANLNLGL